MENVKKGLIISSDTEFFELYKNIGTPSVEIFYAHSIEIAFLLIEKHHFDFAVITDLMYGRIPGIEPGFAIRRDSAGSIYGSRILEVKKVPYIILTKRKDVTKLKLNNCLYFGQYIHPNFIESILDDNGILNF